MKASEPVFEPIRENVPLGPLTTLKVGGPAQFLSRPRTVEELARILERSSGEGLAVRVLGAGSNVLVSDAGVRGLVLVLSEGPFRAISRKEDLVVQCGAGVSLPRLLLCLLDWGLTGAECLAGIPGTVGGALVMNAGASTGEIGALTRRLWAVSVSGEPVELSQTDCGFAYRSSDLGDKVVIGAELLLTRSPPAEIRSRMDRLLEERRRLQPPSGARTAGSTFKNPPGKKAGELLEKAGLKGFYIGGARVSDAHANFIETKEGVGAEDVMGLISEMRRRVREQFDIELELEIDLWGFEG